MGRALGTGCRQDGARSASLEDGVPPRRSLTPATGAPLSPHPHPQDSSPPPQRHFLSAVPPAPGGGAGAFAPPRVRSGTAADQGRRLQMEDASVAIDDALSLAASGSSSYAAAAARAPGAAAAGAGLRGGMRPPSWLLGGGGELPEASGFYAVRRRLGRPGCFGASAGGAQAGRCPGALLQLQGHEHGAVLAEGARCVAGARPCAMQGARARPTSERPRPPSPRRICFPPRHAKVFDGHCGASAAQFAAARAYQRVIYSRHFPHQLAAAMVCGWLGRLLAALGAAAAKGCKAAFPQIRPAATTSPPEPGCPSCCSPTFTPLQPATQHTHGRADRRLPEHRARVPPGRRARRRAGGWHDRARGARVGRPRGRGQRGRLARCAVQVRFGKGRRPTAPLPPAWKNLSPPPRRWAPTSLALIGSGGCNASCERLWGGVARQPTIPCDAMAPARPGPALLATPGAARPSS
jgi:hypothetical protein